MSNHLAVAACTRTLAQLLDGPLTRDVEGAHARPGRPDGAAGADADPETRVFLYRVEPSTAAPAPPLPTRSTNGRIVDRPQLALTLNYLLGFVGNEAHLQPQQMLGSVVRTLTAHPLLTRADIEAMVAAALLEDPEHPLALTDLADQPEVVRLNPLPLTLDELAGLWSSFFDSPYRLAVAYEARVVVLTAEETPTRALPVQSRRLVAAPMLRPTIIRAQSAAGANVPVQVGDRLVLTGSQLRGAETTVVGFGAVEVTPEPGDIAGARIEVEVPGSVRAGVSGVRVIHRRALGDPPTLRLAGQSSVHPLLVQPRLVGSPTVHDVTTDTDTGTRSGQIRVRLDPAVGRTQQVTLLLNAVAGGSGRAYVFEGERRDGAGEPAQRADLELGFTAIEPGTYLMRVGVDGAETPLAIDTSPGSPTEGQYRAPTVVVA